MLASVSSSPHLRGSVEEISQDGPVFGAFSCCSVTGPDRGFSHEELNESSEVHVRHDEAIQRAPLGAAASSGRALRSRMVHVDGRNGTR